jgi:hypothetical protein
MIARRGVSITGIGLHLDGISDEMEDCFRRFDRRGFRKVLKRFEEALNKLTEGRPFEVYVPHMNKILYQEIISHPDCTGYSYLEEGSTSMTWSSRRNAKTSWAKILRSHVRSWWVGSRYQFTRLMFDHSRLHYKSAYVISKLAFQGIPGRMDVSEHIPPLPSGTGDGNTYLILDAIHLLPGVRWEDYEEGLVQALIENRLPPGELLVKFHFAEADAVLKFESIRRRLAAVDTPPLRMLGTDFSVEEHLTREDLLLFAVTTLGHMLWRKY